MLDYVNKRFQKVYYPEREIALDETMLKFKGRLNIKQYINNKPIKWGLKLFTLAESSSGYILHVIPYAGKRPETAVGKTVQTVLDLCAPYYHRGHWVFMDNYYMSPQTLEQLDTKGLHSCGTVQCNRKGLPKDMSKNSANVKKLKRGESLKRMKGNMLAVTWKDTRVVNVLSNLPKDDCLGDTQTDRRTKKDGELITIPKPNIIQTYNQHMGGVDLSDQRIATYRRHMKSLTWYLQIFYLLDLAANQAYLVHKRLHPDSKIRQFTYVLQVVDGLIGGRTYVKRMGRPAPQLDQRFNRNLEHAPVKNATSSKCAVHTRRVDTTFSCGACQVRMCPYPCFHRYHYLTNYAFDDPKRAAAGAPLARKKQR